MSEITLETGKLPVCVDCQIKHITDFIHHVKKSDEPTKFKKARELQDIVRRDLDMTGGQMKGYDRVRRIEHRLEDYASELRRIRRDMQMGKSNPRPRKKAKTKCELKRERCVRKVKKAQPKICKRLGYPQDPKRGCVNPWAVCRASIKCP